MLNDPEAVEKSVERLILQLDDELRDWIEKRQARVAWDGLISQELAELDLYMVFQNLGVTYGAPVEECDDNIKRLTSRRDSLVVGLDLAMWVRLERELVPANERYRKLQGSRDWAEVRSAASERASLCRQRDTVRDRLINRIPAILVPLEDAIKRFIAEPPPEDAMPELERQ